MITGNKAIGGLSTGEAFGCFIEEGEVLNV